MNNHTLGMSQRSTINDWGIDVLIDCRFESPKSKNLLLVGLNALPIILDSAFYRIPITMTETRDTLYFPSERNTKDVLTVLVYGLK